MIRILTTIFMFALLMGCIDNYDMKEAGGKVYRMNKRTGEVDIVEGNSITPITTITAKDKQAIEWAKTHSNDTRANKILAANGIDTYTTQSGNRFTRVQDKKNDSVSKARFFDSLDYKYSNPATGTIKDGYRFLGGNQTDSTRWEPVQSILNTMKHKPGDRWMISWEGREVPMLFEPPWAPLPHH
jgi:hypothetical protein